MNSRLLTAVALLTAGMALADGEDWANAKLYRGSWGVNVQTPDRVSLCQVSVYPRSRELGGKVVARLVENGVEIDLREAFAAGASQVQVHSRRLSADGLAGTDVHLAADVTGSGQKTFAKAEVVANCLLSSGGSLSVRAPVNKVITSRAEPVVPGRQTYALDAILPPDATNVTAVLKFTAPGEGPIVFHGASARPYAAVAKSAPEAARPQKRLFHASFDDSLVAETSVGPAKPVLTKELSFVEGRKGKAVRFTRAAGSRLVYPSKGAVDPERGAMTCWILHDLPVNSEQSLFQVKPTGGCFPGDGSLRVYWSGYRETGIVRWERGDYSQTNRQFGPQAAPFPTNGWVQFTVSWDRKGMTLFANGEQLPRHRISDNTCPLNDALFVPPPLRFSEQWPQAITRLMIGCGKNLMSGWNGVIDDVSIWAEPFTAEDAKAFYCRETGTEPKAATGIWSEPWRNPRTPPPPNRALKAAGPEPGVPTGMELVEDLVPAELAKKGDASRFRVTGQWKTGMCDGQEYLEAGEGLNDRYAVRFRLDGSVPLWCFEITYPDDKARAIDLVVQNVKNASGYSLNHGIETGLEHPLTGKNATKKYLYWRSDLFPTPEENGDLALVVMTQTAGNPAAITRVRVHAIRDGRIPDMPTCDAKPVNGLKRRSAIWFEDPAIRGDFGTVLSNGQNADELLMIDRISAYMRYTGQDTLIYPAVWYAGLISESYQPRQHMSHFMREVCRRFDRDGHVFVPSMNQQWFPEFGLNVTREMLTDGSLHATPISILDTGLPNLGGWHHSPTYYNISHPDVQKALLAEIEELCRECRDHKSFGGVALDPFNSINVTYWGSIAAGYNDYAIDGFERATGVKVPVDRANPLRGRDYAQWLKANAYDRWVQWRCDVVTDFYRRAAETVRRYRPDLMLYVRCALIWRSKIEQRDDLFRDDFTDRILRESGLDCAALSKIPNVSLAACSMPAYWHDELKGLKASKERLERVRDLPETEGYQRVIRDCAYPFADFHESYYETSVGSKKTSGHHSGDGRLNGDWLSEKPWRVTHFSASGREALRPYAKALKYADVFAFGRGGFSIGTCGDEAVTAPWMRTFRAIPAVKFADAEGFAHDDVRCRTAKVDGETWFYAVNTAFAPVELDLPLPEGAVDAVTGRRTPPRVSLDSYEIRAFRLAGRAQAEAAGKLNVKH